MAGERWYLGTDMRWHRKGWPEGNPGGAVPADPAGGVTPGGSGGPPPPPPPPPSNRVQVMRSDLTRTTGGPPPPPPPPPGSNFPGDPGPGEYYVGFAAGPWGNGDLATTRANNPGWRPQQMSVFHNYAGSATVSWSKVDEARNANMIPSQSFHMPGSGTDAQINTQCLGILAGNQDAAIDAMAQQADNRRPWPIWLCFKHEPEDNITTSTTAANFRAASRYIVMRFRAAGVTNVAWQPILQLPWTFRRPPLPSPNRDWRLWHPDWTGSGWQDDLSMDMFGVDMYNPLIWSPDGPPRWFDAAQRSFTFQEMWTVDFLPQVEAPGYPVWDYTIMEFGVSNAMDGTATPRGSGPDWRPYFTAAESFIRAHRIKEITYWDNAPDLGRWTLGNYYAGQSGSWAGNPIAQGDPSPDLNGTKSQGWTSLVNGAKVWTTPTGGRPL